MDRFLLRGLRLVMAIGVLFSAAYLHHVAAVQAQTTFSQLVQFCPTGSAGGQCKIPRGVAIDPASGHVYVAEPGSVAAPNTRVQEFTAWGEFVKSWGWGVVASGPGNEPKNEVQELSVDATGGSFRLRYFNPSEEQTAPIPFDASAATVEAALQGLAPNPIEATVSGPDGGPWTIEYNGAQADTDISNFFNGDSPAIVEPSLLTGGTGASIEEVEKGANFEVCVAARGDVCRGAQPGSAPGQMLKPQGVAVDSDGNVYVVDFGNHRVQKFDPEGNFALMFGGEVNKTTGADVCTLSELESGDECGAAVFGSPGPGEGQFGAWADVGDYIATGEDDAIYVGDAGRIQVFAPDGSFQEQIGSGLTGETVQSLAVGPGGELYLSLVGPFASKEDVRKLDSNGNLLGTIKVKNPRGIAVDSGGDLFVVNHPVPASPKAEVLGFDSAGNAVDLEPGSAELALGKGALTAPTGIAASSPPTCGLSGTDLFVANSDGGNSFVNVYGPAPDPDVCPQPAREPTIHGQFVTSVDSSGASLKAIVNPHFWPDTRYFVEFGTGKCSEGGCDSEQPPAPGSLLTKDVRDVEIESTAVFLTGLEPATTYHYRFVVESGGGGPIVGEERTFRTFAAPSSPDGCPNDAVRTGASAKLPDCRAYELVSPLDKGNGDVDASFTQAAASGERMTFSSMRAFADPDGAPLVNQYLAVREDGSGWGTEPISPARGVPSLYPLGATDSNYFKAFSSDLCEGWLVQDTATPLAAGAPEGVPSLYHRSNCGGGDYELLTSTPPPSYEQIPYETFYYPTIQGFSSDGATSVFRANAALAVADGPRPPFACSVTGEAETTSYQWLRNGAPIPSATAPTYTATAADEGQSIQCQVTTGDLAGASLVTSEVSLVAPAPATAPPSPGVRTPNRPSLPGTPTVSGPPAVGETLSCAPGEWSEGPTFTYQWHRDGVAIAGATDSTYLLTSADRGTAVQCRAIGSNPGGTAVADSERVAIGPSLPLATAPPSISGTPSVGEILTCDPGSWSNSPSFTYQWLRAGANIGGATASTYTLVAADEGKAIQCRVKAANSDATVAAVSARVVVTPPPVTAPPELTEAGGISGDAVVGETLTCDPGTWSGSPTFAYRWQRNGDPITPLATANKVEYTLVAADEGKAIQCQVTATNAGGAAAAIDASASGVAYPEAEPPVAPGARTQGNFQLYVTDGAGELRLVSVMPDGSVSTDNATAGTGWGLSLFTESRQDSVHHAVSDDGSRVFWTAVDFTVPEDQGRGPGRLFLRLNATQAQSAIVAGECSETGKACTIPVSASDARFVVADPQGTRVIYAEGETLRAAEIEETGGQFVANSTPIAGGVKGVMGASDDATRIYLVSTQALTDESEPNSAGDTAQSGQPNLYLYEQDGSFTFVATLDGLDVQTALGANAAPSVISFRPDRRSAQVSPDGLHAAFTSVAPLTGYDNIEVGGEEPAAEVFLFDAEAGGGTGALLCASCDPSGARPETREVWTGSAGTIHAAAQIPGWNSQLQPRRALSENGNRLFFNSFDALAPGDTNGKADVYQWEAAGEGTCTESRPSFSQQNGGCVNLISSGEGGEDSELLDASADGSDVFFITQSGLVSDDYGLRDVYDARIGGGFPGAAPPPAGCEGEACQSAPGAPNDPTPSTASFNGPGNVKQPPGKRCRKGQRRVRRNGKVRCVRKKTRKGAGKHRRRSGNRRGGVR